jgi:hypothetical protein
MKTIRTKVYSFSELSEEAKEKAVSQYRNKDYDYQFYYNEIIDSVKKVVDLFNLKTGREWTDIRTSDIDDNICNLSGVRLYKYIINNYGNCLFKPQYLKCIDRAVKYKAFICKINKGQNGEYTMLYSKYKKDNSCVLTGVCYDDDILEPVYSFLARPDKSMTFEELINEVESAISKTFDNTTDWINSDEFITDEIEANDYQFTKDGKIFNY